MWGMTFPFHTLMQEKKWQSKFNNNMYVDVCAFLNIFFINLYRLISCNHKHMVQSNNSQTNLFLQNNNTFVLSNVGPLQAVSFKL
jgi:hypothetical protein